MKHLAAIFVVLTILSGHLHAGILRGRVLDEKTRDPIASVNIYVRELRLYTQSDSAGAFSIEQIESGTYNITFRRIGYHEQEGVFVIGDGDKLEVFLKKEVQKIEGVKISSTRARIRETPVTFTNLPAARIQENNYGQDIPMIMSDLPNLYAYSESGNGFGYTYLKLRGFDQSRIGVMINGIPLNDPEDHRVYWVDMPDFAENISDIQIQRGVGSSLYGISTFGGSVNLETSILNEANRLELFSNYGSYSTYKAGVKFIRELLPGYKLSLRFSRIGSDGYRDNSSVRLWSWFSGFSRVGERSVTEVNIYGGNEVTQAAWYASSETDLEENHQHNPIEYENEIDDFNQPHFEFHHRYYLSDFVDLKNTLFYIRGDGYYEQFKEGEDLWEYGLSVEEDSLYSDLVRRKNVAKNQFGIVSNIHWDHAAGELDLGLYGSLFDSEHWGEIHELHVESAGFEPDQKYYRHQGDKTYLTFYLNENLAVTEKLNLMLNLHYQMIDYEFAQKEEGNFNGLYLNSYEVDYDFFNPRIGINYNLDEHFNIYANVSSSQREPTDNELYDLWDGPDDLGVQPLFTRADTLFENGNIAGIKWSDPQVKSEKLIDYELGAVYRGTLLEAGLNLFWMDFENEIVGYGGVNEDGYPIRGNAEETVHRGIEFYCRAQLPSNLELSANLAYNDNYFREFKPFNWSGGNDDYSGNRIGGFPDLLGSSRLSYRSDDNLIWLNYRYSGRQYLDNTENRNRVIDPYQVLDLGIFLNIGDVFGIDNLELNFRINNLLDKKYFTAGYYDDWAEENYYWPAAGRNYMAGLRITI